MTRREQLEHLRDLLGVYPVGVDFTLTNEQMMVIMAELPALWAVVDAARKQAAAAHFDSCLCGICRALYAYDEEQDA